MWTFWTIEPIKAHIDAKSSNHHKFSKLGTKIKNPTYEFNTLKHTSFFAQNTSIIQQPQYNLINSISKIQRGKFTKSTPTKAQVTFLDNSPTNTTPAPNNTSHAKTTPSTSSVDTADDQRLTETMNGFFSKELLAFLTWKDAILKEIIDCVIWNDEEQLTDFSPYIYSYWRNMSVKHRWLCLD